jgi:uncharacterized membrane protein YeiH
MIVYYLGLLGVFVFAVSGALAAGEKQFDWVGVVVLAVITSLGGGTLRDVLLDGPAVFWIEDPNYLVVAIASAFLTILYCKWLRPPVKSLQVADALGLALFAIVGAQVAETAGVPPLIVIVMGILTGVAGGVLRDILANEVPLLFRPTETIYSVAALGGIVLYLALQEVGVERVAAAISGVVLISLLRLSAIFFDLKLPTFNVSGD